MMEHADDAPMTRDEQAYWVTEAARWAQEHGEDYAWSAPRLLDAAEAIRRGDLALTTHISPKQPWSSVIGALEDAGLMILEDAAEAAVEIAAE